LTESIKDLGTKQNFIISASSDEAYSMNKQVKVVGLIPFLRDILPQILK
jgi:hypothetical protein